MTDTPLFRPFTPADIPAGKAMSDAEGWPPRHEDWATHLSHGAGVAVDRDGRMVACALVTALGDRVATLSNVLVHRDARGGGLGRRAVEAALALPEARGREVRLWATEQGRPLYEKLGFAAEDGLGQHQGVLAAAPAPVAPPAGLRLAALTPSQAAGAAAIDRAALHADRTARLERIFADPEAEALGLEGPSGLVGWAARRRFGLGLHVGPVHAPDAAGALALVTALLAGCAGRFVRMDLPCGPGLGPRIAALGLPRVGGGDFMRRDPVTPAPAPFAMLDQGLG